MTSPPMIENRTFAEIAAGESASLTRTLSLHDAELFAVLAGDGAGLAPQAGTGIAIPGVWASILVPALLDSRLPGPGSVLLSLDFAFLQPLTVGDRVTVTVTATAKDAATQVVQFDCLATNQDGAAVLKGRAAVKAPAVKAQRCCAELPDIRVNDHVRHRQLIARCKGLAPMTTAVVHPVDAVSLAGAVEAAQMGLIEPILVGPEAKIRAAAGAAGLDISPYRLIATPHSHAAAAQAVALAHDGRVEALMKGSLHTDELMHEVMLAGTGLRTERRISHVYLFDVVSYPRPLFITDAAINIQPTLPDKRDICQNAIDLAHILGVAVPKVAILSAVETVTDKMPSTLDAAALCKMADRGQITGGLLDGPLAFDNAVSLEAARTKHIVSPVAGQADILLVPDLEAGNMLAKQLTFFNGADAAAIVLGARIPIILTSRADSARTRIASCAIAALIAESRRHP